MEELYQTIRLFLLGTVNGKIREHNKKTDDDIPLFTEDNIKFGTIDPFRNPAQKMLCSVYPNSQSSDFTELSTVQTTSNFTLTVVNKNELYKKLLSHTCSYSNIIVGAVSENYTLETTVEDSDGNERTYSVYNTDIGERTFYPDAGTAEKQATAVEINLTIYQTTEIGD